MLWHFGGRPAAAVPGSVLREDGHPVSLCGLERGEGAEGFPQLSPEELGQLCQVILLPLPATRDGITLNAPLARAPILLDSGLAQCLKGCTVLAGMAGGLRKCSPLWETLPVMDYYAREELTLGQRFSHGRRSRGPGCGAQPRRAGGLPLFGGGFGRIGKALCLALRGLGARWTAPHASLGTWRPSGPWAAPPYPMAASQAPTM